MPRERSRLRILLLQTRRSETVRVEERPSSAEHAGLGPDQIDSFGGVITRDEVRYELGTIEPPEGCLLLARTDLCIHAFRFAGRVLMG